MAGFPNSFSLQQTTFNRRGTAARSITDRKLPGFLSKIPAPPTEDQINDIRATPVIENEDLRTTAPQKPGYKYGDRLDPLAGNSTKTAEEYVRRLLIKYKNPLYQLLRQVCASAGVRDPDDYTEKSSSLLLENYNLATGNIDPLDASLSREDVPHGVDKDFLEKIIKLASDNPKFPPETIKQLLNLVPKNQPIDINYTSSWENLGIIRFNQSFIYALESGVSDLKTKYPNVTWTLGRLVLTKDTQVFLQFSNLCAYYINKPKTRSFSRPIERASVQDIELDRQRALNFFERVEQREDDYKVITSKPVKRIKFQEIDDIYDSL